ncbi:MAG: hypothetical protein V4691_05875 [Pseudomonadota bacterium]
MPEVYYVVNVGNFTAMGDPNKAEALTEEAFVEAFQNGTLEKFVDGMKAETDGLSDDSLKRIYSTYKGKDGDASSFSAEDMKAFYVAYANCGCGKASFNVTKDLEFKLPGK